MSEFVEMNSEPTSPQSVSQLPKLLKSGKKLHLSIVENEQIIYPSSGEKDQKKKKKIFLIIYF